MKYAIRIPRLAGVISWLLLTFLVMFPKGGIKINDAPLTWGYGLLALLFIPLTVARGLGEPLRTSPLTLAAFASLFPFQVILLYSFWANGADNPTFVVALLLTFIFLPIVFLGVFPGFLRFVNFERFRRHFCFCILAAALWGIFLFFYHPIMGHFIEIPYLTVNAGDYGQLENTKHIDRGAYLKLISTYNNGNLYGIATLILFPLYLLLEPRTWKRNVVRVALVLTLSRTVWVGLVMEQLLSLAVKLPAVVWNFPRVRPGRILPRLIAIGATVALVLVGLFFNGNGVAFLFDRELGGRLGGLGAFESPTLLPSARVNVFSELLYASSLALYGIVGFFAIMLIFATPVFLILWKPWLMRSPTRRAAVKGLILYAIVAGLDGAVLLIPVMAFYFFAYMVLIHGMPGESNLAAVESETAARLPNPPLDFAPVAID
jgi:hypothetical protein